MSVSASRQARFSCKISYVSLNINPPPGLDANPFNVGQLGKTKAENTMSALTLHPDRLFPSGETERVIARRLFKLVEDLPIISPHGHTDPAWFSGNENFTDPSSLLIIPDHYIFRMLYSQGVPLSRRIACRGRPPKNLAALRG